MGRSATLQESNSARPAGLSDSHAAPRRFRPRGQSPYSFRPVPLNSLGGYLDTLGGRLLVPAGAMSPIANDGKNIAEVAKASRLADATSIRRPIETMPTLCTSRGVFGGLRANSARVESEGFPSACQ